MEKKFDIKGMTCASCQAHVQKAVEKLKGVNKVNVNLLTNSMNVDFDEKILDVETIEKAVKNVGYEACSIDKVETKKVNQRQDEIKIEIIKLVISFIFLILLMYVSMGHMIGLPLPSFLDGEENAIAFAFTQLLLTIPSLLIFSHYFKNGFRSLFKLSPNMDSLIAVGASASLIYGIFAIYMIGYGLGHNNMDIVNNYRHNLYFESAAMILTLVSLGKLFEKISKKKTTKAIEKLVDLSPKTARVKRDEIEIEIPSEQIQVGDIVVVRQGDIVPIDGEVTEGNGSIDESNMTGESIPVYKQKGDKVYSACVLSSGYLLIKANKVGQDTSINTIIKLVDEASNSKAPISKLVDKISLIFVPTIFIISITTLIGFWAGGYGFERAFNFAISVLVIACPCALGLATPVAIMVGVGKGAQSGLIIKNAEILEQLHNVKTVVFDKTGTISKGRPSVTDYIKIKYVQDLDSIIYSLEKLSNHPLANALIEYFDSNENKELNVTNFKTIEGFGLSGEIAGETYYIGNQKKLNKDTYNKNEETIQNLAKDGKTVIFVLKNKELLAILAIKDEIKETSKDAIQLLKKKGIQTIMLTGDNEVSANAIASEVGIDKVYSQVLPVDKSNIINSLKKDKKHLVAMVGDGVNDAIALTSADLGIAIGAGSEVAIESADIVLIKNDLIDVVNAINLSKVTYRTIILNLFWAFFYNCIGILLACGIFYPAFNISLNPMIGSLAMSLSSVFVVCNALTINLFKIKHADVVNEKEVKLIDDKITLKKGEENKMDNIHLSIDGMMCQNCVRHVKEALTSIEGVEEVNVSLENKSADVKGTNLNKDTLISAVKNAGYEAK